ncbi:MAG: hypothetical protein A2161_14785 [Candidatus Schekmanbacteria bacterium RBG_13_48_7]|uniref:Uncharacterized protein n=1 Tax=Candidatus Schekmanbacteria bacterium RBG_13_48_7 TaxID=1817878 RepID=A0A1F7RWP5_9BACT|nr:MAG: hypothetical protein A2161_14785 [Candidatus Schekmanbacteria bacterium RBG_13_48_7]
MHWISNHIWDIISFILFVQRYVLYSECMISKKCKKMKMKINIVNALMHSGYDLVELDRFGMCYGNCFWKEESENGFKAKRICG